MKNKKLLLILVFALTIVLSLSFAACGKKDDDTGSGGQPSGGGEVTIDAPDWTVSSPDGDIKVGLYLENGKVYYDVKKGEYTAIVKSGLGMSTDKTDFYNLAFVEKQEQNKTISYTNLSGKVKQVTTTFNETTLTFSEDNFLLDVTMRAYNDGYAFRYGIREAEGKTGEFKIIDETSYFDLPDTAITYGSECILNSGLENNGEYFSYEDKYQYRSYKNIGSENFQLPFLYYFKAGDSEIYALISEADIYGHDYHGSALSRDGNYGLKTVHMPACGDEASLQAAYPFTSPWRVTAIGGLDTIVESTLVEDVYDEVEPWKPDNYDSLSKEEQAVYTYDWVNPGPAAWSYLNVEGDSNKFASQHNWDLQKTYVDAIADLGWTWLVLDAGWNQDLNEAVFKDFVKYCNDKGLHVMVWADSYSSFYTRGQTQVTLRKWASYGIEGVKIDFFDGQGAAFLSSKWKLESQQSLDDHYEMFYQEAAKVKMVVDCHGCNKPTGERRKYPNVINREAIRGYEFKSVDAKQTVLLPLTRCVVGPSDFTPAIISYYSDTVTVAHNMSMAITMESGMPTFSDVPDHYKTGEWLDFYRSLPVVWDETKLVTAKIGDNVVIARRSGNKWYVGGSSAYKDTINVDLSFLSDGNHTVTVWTDVEGDNNAVKKSQQTVTKATTLSLDVQKGGGFALIIE